MNTYQVDRRKWNQQSIIEQMGNIYSEVGRSLRAKKQGRTEDAEAAMVRSLDLFDATVEGLIKQGSIRTREVLRARDQYLQIYSSDSLSDEETKSLDNYFLQYAVAARQKS